MDADHHLPGLLGLGRVVEPAPHGVAPFGNRGLEERTALGTEDSWGIHPLSLPHPQLTSIPAGPAVASPLIIQVNQGPDVIAEVDSGHNAPWIGLAAVTDMGQGGA